MSHGWILILMGALFLGLGYIGVPVAFSITAGVLVATMLTPISLPSIIGQLFNGVDSEALLAVPFFLLVGELMTSANVVGRMITLSQTMIGHLRGGLAQVVTLFSAYGAQVVHMPFGEVYTSLQTGVVEVAENGVNVYLSNKHYEVAPVMSMSEHEANNNCIWVSDKAWNSFNDEEKKWVQAAADEVNRLEPGKAIDLEHESMAKLEKIGVKFVKDVDKSGFLKVAEPIQDNTASALGPYAVELLKLVREVK